ncbi:hypothetical protein EVAR_58882_1 [Eumeta japonica]|uniref:Integrase catalytic domain-containing protein n=1 Tax=Eumeta variegata TaxID=151549 RepID=A0A4C1ZCJ5_EUMVA|nr:hypothetical protein EVAR_58882_1 [Eumeta japonica]
MFDAPYLWIALTDLHHSTNNGLLIFFTKFKVSNIRQSEVRLSRYVAKTYFPMHCISSETIPLSISAIAPFKSQSYDEGCADGQLRRRHQKGARGRPVERESRLHGLSVTMDQGMIKLNTRISRVEGVGETTKSPAVLAGEHPYTRLYIAWTHVNMHHGGVESVVNELRQRIWVLRLRPSVRSVIRSCLLCRIRKTKATEPLTGEHPSARLALHQRPFTLTGLDFCGPYLVTVGRQHHKRYVALFTCLTTRAVHLELAGSLSADAAILTLRRFMARRGCPTETWSDRGTNFVGANNELRREALPHPREEVLSTLLAEVEFAVNSRPLTHVSVSAEDPEALTPNHFLLGGTARQRWLREYLPLLQRRHDSQQKGTPPEVDDVVLIVDENLPRNTWPRGRVVELYPGKGGVVRVVEPQTAAGRLKRPVKKIVVLPK